MSTSDQDNVGITVALVGSAALLLWLLWPGRGKGDDRGHGGNNEGSGVREPVIVRIRAGDRLELDGTPADLAATIARARVAGAARVIAIGDARHGWVTTVIDALKNAGVDVAMQAIGGSVPDSARTVASALGSLRKRGAPLTGFRNASPASLPQSCPPHPAGGGALVRSSYRVPPFLTDDILLVPDNESNTKGRVYCVAYDITWHERHLERSGWLDRDTLTPIMTPGMRVELSPLCPLWQQGATHGTIREITKNWTVVVKMDDPGVRRLQRFTDHTQLRVRESQLDNQ